MCIYFSFSNVLGKEESNPITVLDGHLLMAVALSARDAHVEVDENGFMKILDKNSPFTSFSLDVGFNRGQTSMGWSAKQPSVYIIGIEANARLVSHFEHNPEFLSIRPHTLVVNAAAGTKEGGLSHFNPGFGWSNTSDTGSLFGWKDKNREAERMKYVKSHLLVRQLRLDSLLRHVPPPRAPKFVWDTLKLDIQGADVDALHSAGVLVDNFMCVVGEFDELYYTMPKDFPTDPVPFLTEHQFKRVHDMWPGNSIWLNRRYFDLYKENPHRFGCHSVYDSPVDPSKLIAEYEKGIKV